MPAIHFEISLADGHVERCYSPSSVICELLTEGADYPVFEFMARTRAALTIGSERVRRKYGYACSAAADQLARLEALVEGSDQDERVTVSAFERHLT